MVLSALALGTAAGLTAQQTLTLWAKANWLQDAVIVQDTTTTAS